MNVKGITPYLGRAAIVALMAAALTGCSAPPTTTTEPMNPTQDHVPISTSFLEPTFIPSLYDPAAIVSEMCVSAVAAQAAIQSIIDAKDGCAAITDHSYGGNPRALFQHVDAGGAEALAWQTVDLVRFTGEMAGVYRVIKDDWVAYGDTKNFPDLGTDILFQTCSWDVDGGSEKMRVVGLNRVA